MRRRSVALFGIAIMLVSGPASSTLAQEASGIGVAVPYVDVDGVTHGAVSVIEVNDPFSDYDPNSPPADGTRYVNLIASFESAADQQYDVQPYHIFVRDTTGKLYAPQFVRRPADALYSDLQGQPMSPNNKVSGAINFIVPADITLDEVLYVPTSERVTVLVDQVSGSHPGAGETVPFTAGDGSGVTITTTLVDPAPDVDPNQPPPAGKRFVALSTVFENPGPLPYYADPYRLQLRDTNGSLYWSGYVPRLTGVAMPALEAHTTAPGDRISGITGFTVPLDAVFAGIDYVPASDMRIVVADLSGGSTSAPQPAATAAATATEAAASASPDASAGTGQ